MNNRVSSDSSGHKVGRSIETIVNNRDFSRSKRGHVYRSNGYYSGSSGHNVGRSIEIVNNDDFLRSKRDHANRSSLISFNPISVIESDRNRINVKLQHLNNHSVNRSNLIQIPLNDEHIQSTDHMVRFAVINAQSVRNKHEVIHDYIIENELSICALTETWLNKDDTIFETHISPPGFSTLSVPRIGRRGGGLAVICDKILNPKLKTIDDFETFEAMAVSFTYSRQTLVLILIYRPPCTPTSKFLTDFNMLLETVALSKDKLVICGDFNLHVDYENDAAARKFLHTLALFGLSQTVSDATHVSGHTLDLIITRTDETSVSPPDIDAIISDHFAVLSSIKLSTPKQHKKLISFRKVKSIDIANFKSDVKEAFESVNFTDFNLDTCVEIYNKTLRTVLDSHAPLRQKWIPLKAKHPWHIEQVSEEKNKRRKIERAWRKNWSHVCLKALKKQRNYTNFVIRKSKSDYYVSQITHHKGDYKRLFKIFNDLLETPSDTSYPSASSDLELANGFATFFKTKVDKIKDRFDQIENLPTSSEVPSRFSEFLPQSIEDIKRLLCSARATTCKLDPIPSHLLKCCDDEVAPILSYIVNQSLRSGYMPRQLKEAHISPLLKKSNLDPVYSNFRPVSNLPFISKIIERAVANQINPYCNRHDLYEPLQSAYRKDFSTETALVKVLDDVFRSIDQQEVVLLGMLDLSAAFDTVNHDILLSRLRSSFGITDSAQNWFTSYLADRTQCVVINDSVSVPVKLETGVPQGSGLGPWEYTCYTKELGGLIILLSIMYHFFADDGQIFKSANPNCLQSLLDSKSKLEDCIRKISNWMFQNHLKLNESKTEFIIFGTKAQLKKVPFNSLEIAGDKVTAVTCVRNLGVYLDQELTMKQHVTHLVKVSYLWLRKIRVIRPYLTEEATHILIQTLILSRIDYCNSLLIGISNVLLNKLQLVQNACARVIKNLKKYDRVSDARKALHWLPIEQRIEYKVALLVFKSLHRNEPGYLKELLVRKHSHRPTRSHNQNLLEIPKTKLCIGQRSFSFSGPKIWNSLPANLRSCNSVDSFKKNLKTYLFKRAYNV